jgi:hypothetical protein
MLDGELAAEDTALVGRANGTLDFSLDVGDVGLIDDHLNAYLDRSRPTIRTLLHALLHLLRDHHHHLLVHS